MALMNCIITAKGEEFPLEGMTLVLRHLALEGEEKTSVYLITKDEEEKEVKVLLATLSAAVPQHACEIPITGEVIKLVCEGNAKVHAILTPEMEDLDDMDFDEDMSEEDNGDFASEEEEEEEKPVEAPKKEEKKPVAPKKEEKKPQPPKKEEKKEEKKPQPPKKEAKPQPPKKEQPKKENKPQQKEQPKKEFHQKEGNKFNKNNKKGGKGKH